MLRYLLLLTTIVTAILQVGRAGAAEVTIDNFTFSPAEITVKAGETITFTNHDDIPHSVVGKGGKFRSKALDTDDKFTFSPARGRRIRLLLRLAPPHDREDHGCAVNG